MSDKAIGELALEWLSNPATEIYGRQLMWAWKEKPSNRIKEDFGWTCGTEIKLWEVFEKEQQENDLEALKADIKALHYKVDHIYDKQSCCQCGQAYPCRTLKLLEGY